MMKVRRMTSILLTIVMLIGMMSSAVFTADAAEPRDPENADYIGTNDPAFSDGDPVTAVDGTTYAGQDYRQWVQYDSRWSTIPLGSSACTIGSHGCTVTAVTKLIIEAGLAKPTELNPGVLVRYLNDHDGFTAKGALYWSKVTQFCKDVLGKDFKCYVSARGDDGGNTLNAEEQYEYMIARLREGYHLALQVGSGEHWIAVDGKKTLDANDGKVYVMDSWRYDPNYRINVALKEHLTYSYGNNSYLKNGTTLKETNKSACMESFDRIVLNYADPDDPENADPDEYNTDDFRRFSRYDSRWATTIVGYPSASGTNKADFMGDWGQAHLAFTKALLQAGVTIPDANANGLADPDDAIALLQEKGLITMNSATLSGVIDWNALAQIDGITDSECGMSTVAKASLTAEDIIREMQENRKHYVLRLSSASQSEYAWVAVDEPTTLATGEIYVLASSGNLSKNSSLTLNEAMAELGVSTFYRVHSFTVEDPTVYHTFSYSASDEHLSLSASYAYQGETIPFASGSAIPDGAEITVTASPAVGYAAASWSVSGTAGVSGALTYTVTPDEDTTVTAAAVPGNYAVSYVYADGTGAEDCGFAYGSNTATADFGTTVTFTVTAVNEYSVTFVGAIRNDTGEALELTRSGTSYTFTQPASDVTVTAEATPETYTVFLVTNNDGADYVNGDVMYAYTYTTDQYGTDWIKGVKVADGYYRFDGVKKKLNFARIRYTRASPSVDEEGFMALNSNDKWNYKDNQTDDLTASENAVFTITGWSGGSYGNMTVAEGVAAGPNTVYLYPKAIDVRALDANGNPYMEQFANYPKDYYLSSENEYYALTWYAATPSLKTWVKGSLTRDEQGNVLNDGLLTFTGVKDRVRFFRVNPDGTPSDNTTNTSGDDVWGYTNDALTVDTAANDLYVLNRHYFYKDPLPSTASNENENTLYTNNKELMLGYWAKSADVMSLNAYGEKYALDVSDVRDNEAYKYWTKNDARWRLVRMGTSTAKADANGKTDETGFWTLSQALAKLSQQAAPDGFDGWDVTDYTVKAINASGLFTFASDGSKIGLTYDSANSSTTVTSVTAGTNGVAAKIFDLLLRGKHILLRGNASDEWYVVDEEKTLMENTDYTNLKIYVLRSTETGHEVGDFISSAIADDGHRVDTQFKYMYVYNGGTTPGLTRDYDYRAWNRYDGRWRDIQLDNAGKYYMSNGGATILAVAKLMVQAGIVDPYDQENPWNPSNFIADLQSSSYQGIDSGGNFIWYKTNNYHNSNITFTSDGTSWTNYLAFSYEKNGATVTKDYHERYDANDKSIAYFTLADEQEALLEAIKQGYHMTIKVFNSLGYQDWLAVDEKLSLENGEIYIMDSTRIPGMNVGVRFADRYTKFNRVTAFKGGTTPLPEETAIETEVIEGETVTIKSPQLLPDTGDTPYFDRSYQDGRFVYNFVYGTDTGLVAKVAGASLGQYYRFYLAEDEETALEGIDTVQSGLPEGQENYYDVLATADNTDSNGVLTVNLTKLLDTRVKEGLNIVDSISLAVKSINYHTVMTYTANGKVTSTVIDKTQPLSAESAALSTTMYFKAYELSVQLDDTSFITVYSNGKADKSETVARLKKTVSGCFTNSADSITNTAAFSGTIVPSYVVRDKTSAIVRDEEDPNDFDKMLEAALESPGVYTVTLSAATATVPRKDDKHLPRQLATAASASESSIIIHPSYNTYSFRVVGPSAYVYRYNDRSGEETTYTRYLNTLSDEELSGYRGNEFTPGMPQYISVENDGEISNPAISAAPKVNAGFNKNLTWSDDADNGKLSHNARSFTVTLNADEAPATFRVTFRYWDADADKRVNKTVEDVYNTLIRLGDSATLDADDKAVIPVPTIDGDPDSPTYGKAFSYWAEMDDDARVISVYPSFNMMIAEDATYTAVYGADASAADGDGIWDAYIDGVKNSYKIEGDNHAPVRTVYTDFSIRFIDGNKRIQNLLDAEISEGKVEAFGIIVAYDTTDHNNVTEKANTIKASAETVAKNNGNNVSRTLSNGSKIRFFNYRYSGANQITNRNRADIGVAWDYDVYADKNVVGYSYVIYYDTNGGKRIAVSDGKLTTVDWTAGDLSMN